MNENSNKFPLHHYVSLEDYESLQSLLSNEHYRNQLLLSDDNGHIPIHIASQIPASSNIIRLLLQHCPESASIKDNYNNLPIHYYTSAIKNDSVLAIKLLFNAYQDAIRERDCNNELLIHDMIRHIDTDDEVADLILLFVSLYPESVLEPDCHGQFPVHIALEKNASLKVIEGLLKSCPSLVMGQTKPYHNNHLHHYLKTGTSVIRLDIVKFLIDVNKDQLEQKDWLNCKPIHICLKCRSPEDVVITIIRATKIFFSDRDGDGNNILMLAIKHDHSINVLKAIFNETKDNYTMHRDLDNRNYFLLLSQYQPQSHESLELLIRLFPSDINDTNIEGANALHVAIQNHSSYMFVKTLIDACPLLCARKNSSTGHLPIHVAAANPSINSDIIKLIGCTYSQGCQLQTDDGDGNLALHIAASKGSSIDIIRNLLLINSSAASVKNKHGQYPFLLAIHSNASLSVLVAIIFAHPGEFKGLLSATDHLKDEDRRVLSFVISLLKEKSQLSTARIHLCGNSYSGKTTFRKELKETLGKSFFANHMNSLFVRSHNKDYRQQTIGMECDIFDDDSNRRRWIVHDYGGESEFHINHSKFLATPGSVYIIVVALYDFVNSTLLDEDEILLRYRYWVKYIFSIAADPHCLTLINFKKRSDEIDKDFSNKIEQLISNEQRNWIGNITFVAEPIKLDVIHRDEVFKLVNNSILEAVSRLNINKAPVSVIINECLKRKIEWPKAITEIQLIHEFIFPILEEFTESSEVPESFVDPICTLLCEFIVHQLVQLGEILVVEASNSVNWAITDPNWLTGPEMLGKIFYSRNGSIKKNSVVHMQDVVPLTTELIDIRAEATAGFNFLADHLDYLPSLLQAIGICMPVYNNQLQLLEQNHSLDLNKSPVQSIHSKGIMWFPSFIDINAGIEDCKILPIANRIVIRRFRLTDPSKQIFPPGLFPSLFVNVAGLERCSTNLKFFNDGMELVANYSYETTPFNKHRSKVQIIINRFNDYFDVIVAGVKVAANDSYIFSRLENIRNIIFNPSPSAWQKNVSLNEFCVHPQHKTKEISLSNTLLSLANPESREEMLSYFYGELDGVAVEEHSSSLIYNEKAGMNTGLEEFYKKSTSFQQLQEVVTKLKGLATQIDTTMKHINVIVDESHAKAKTIIREVVSLKNGIPDAKRILDDEDEVNNVGFNRISPILLSTDESSDEIDRIENKAEQLMIQTSSMKKLLRKLDNAYDESNELIKSSLLEAPLPSPPNLSEQLLHQLNTINMRMDYVSDNVERLLTSNNKIAATIQSIVKRCHDIPAFPLIIMDPESKDWKRLGFKKSKLFFICPITLKIAESGINQKGYSIYAAKTWLLKVIPLLKMTIIILQIAVRSMGIPIVIPIPDFPNDNIDDVYLSQLNNALDDNLMLHTSGNGLAVEMGSGIVSLDQINVTQKAQELLNDIIDERSKATDNLDDNVFASLGQLLRMAGDPMPNDRPMYTGLVGPIVSKCDGCVTWVHESAVEAFHLYGKKAFFSMTPQPL